MNDDRSLSDIIRFLDPTGGISDSDIADITKDLKFTEVLDLISFVSKDDFNSARNILVNHNERFGTGGKTEEITREYSTVPTVNKSGFKPIRPSPTIAGNSLNTNKTQKKYVYSTTDLIINDPKNQNKPEIRQIKNLLQRIINR